MSYNEQNSDLDMLTVVIIISTFSAPNIWANLCENGVFNTSAKIINPGQTA